ncbi:MAG: hypothetical protein MI861_27340, partial [Pirellulales bacterium]|nr:hypothetical protein [Pirellulales bacterium]
MTRVELKNHNIFQEQHPTTPDQPMSSGSLTDFDGRMIRVVNVTHDPQYNQWETAPAPNFNDHYGDPKNFQIDNPLLDDSNSPVDYTKPQHFQPLAEKLAPKVDAGHGNVEDSLPEPKGGREKRGRGIRRFLGFLLGGADGTRSGRGVFGWLRAKIGRWIDRRSNRPDKIDRDIAAKDPRQIALE